MGDKRKRLTPHDLTERRARLIELVRDGRHTWEHIADQCGYGSRGAACQDYHRILKARQAEIAAGLDDQRAAHLDGLMEIRRVAVEVMRREHPFVQGGKVVHAGATEDDPGTPLYDDGPALAAIDRIAKIDAQIAQLLGLNAPTRVEADGQLVIRVESGAGEDPINLKDLT